MPLKSVELMLDKAAQDEYVLDKLLADADAPVEIFGFHAQQAAEKYLKAILLSVECEYPRTHRLTELIDLARGSGVDFPERFEEIRFLTPFAVEFRYDAMPEEPEDPLDKVKIRELLADIRRWVESFVNRDGEKDEE